MVFKAIYRATGGTYYCKFVKQVENAIWDNANAEMAESPTWVNSAVPIIEESGTGVYSIIVPDVLPRGVVYDIVVYKQAGVFPADTDVVDTGYVLRLGSLFWF